jgi:hypothetical protein
MRNEAQPTPTTGLHPTSKRKRVLSSRERKVIDGPFAETKELIAGFWPWQVSSEWCQQTGDSWPLIRKLRARRGAR